MYAKIPPTLLSTFGLVTDGLVFFPLQTEVSQFRLTNLCISSQGWVQHVAAGLLQRPG